MTTAADLCILTRMYSCNERSAAKLIHWGDMRPIGISALIIFLSLCVSQAPAEKKKEAAAKEEKAEEKKPEVKKPSGPSSGRGTDFADKEQTTETLEARRKRVRAYERALAKGRKLPEVAASEMDLRLQRERNLPPRELPPRTRIVRALQADPLGKEQLGSLKTYLSESTNAQDRALLGTAYCLGCLVTDQWSEGSKMSVLMKRAFPKDPNVKLLSLETFATDCRNCGGKGKASQKCSSCKGKVKCPFRGCRDGKMSNRDFRIGDAVPQCPKCAGTGKCTSCEGSGSEETRCGNCRGKGKELRKETIERGYVNFLRGIRT